MTDPYTVTDESDSEDEGAVIQVNTEVRNDPVGEGGDGTDPTLPEEVGDPEPTERDDGEEGEDSE